VHVIIGSKNPVKINAIKNVFNRFFPTEKIIFSIFEVPSNVSNQPIGLENVIKGAINRAKNAFSMYLKNRDTTSDLKIFSVGIEAGLVSIPFTISGYLDYQYCAILDQDQHVSIGSGSGWEYPPEIIKEILNDPLLEVGTLMAKISGDPNVKYRNGAIGYYSKNLLTRPVITEECVQMALIPYLNHEKYFSNKKE
jgi:inosine/xanthosine triphosphatase